MMSNASTSIALRGGAVASAGILALGLVVVPPDVPARTEVRAVQLTTWTLPEAAEGWGALVREFTRRQAEPVMPGTSGGGAADVPAVVVNTQTGDLTVPSAADSSTDPQSPQEATATALAATPAALALPAPIVAFLGALVLFGPLIVLVILACPPCAVINFLSYIPSFFGIYLPVPVLPLAAAAPTATVEATATVAPTLTSDPPSEATEPESGERSAPVASDDGKFGTEPEKSAESVTGNEQRAADAAGNATETVAAETVPKEQRAEPTKPAGRPATPRPVVRDSLGTEKKTSDPSHRGNGGQAASEEPAGSRAATAGSSSSGSSSTDGSSEGGGSSEGDSADS